MTKKEAEAIAEITNGEIRDAYSGRGMYGKTCYGVVVDSLDDLIEGLGRYITEIPYGTPNDPNHVGPALENLRMDEMGLEKILY